MGHASALAMGISVGKPNVRRFGFTKGKRLVHFGHGFTPLVTSGMITHRYISICPSSVNPTLVGGNGEGEGFGYGKLLVE